MSKKKINEVNNKVDMPKTKTDAVNKKETNNKKKIVGVVVCAVIVVLIVVLVFVAVNVFGSKKLTCEYTRELAGITMSVKEEINFKKDKESIINSTIIYTKEEGFDDTEFETMKTSLDNIYGKVTLGEDLDITRGDKEIKVTGTRKEIFDEKSVKELKKNVEDAGFTCK